MSSEELRTLTRIQELLEAITRRIMKDSLATAVADKHYKFLYENTGKMPVKVLAEKTGLSTGTISRTWQQWEDAGLLIKDGKQYRRLL